MIEEIKIGKRYSSFEEVVEVIEIEEGERVSDLYVNFKFIKPSWKFGHFDSMLKRTFMNTFHDCKITGVENEIL